MGKDTSNNIYRKKVNAVMDFINQNSKELHNLDSLSEIANLSPFHFHRIFKACTGETLGGFLIRSKVESAAKLLRYTDNSISNVAYEAGFDTPAGLTKAFKKFYGITPTFYRNTIEISMIENSKREVVIKEQIPQIIELNELEVAYIRLIGDYGKVDYAGAWNELSYFFTKNNLWDENSKGIGICYDNPEITEAEHCRYDICFSTAKQFKTTERIGKLKVPSGKFAVFTHIGAYQNLNEVYDFIYGKWLLESGYELRDTPTYDKYLNNPMDTPESELKTEIYIPII